MKIARYDEIPLDRLDIGRFQARVSDVSKNVDELAASIAKLGLLEPIVVAPSPTPGRFEIVTGQRRFLAVQRLGWKSIRAGVLDEQPSGDLAKAISLTENLVREEMADKDYVDACTTLFHRYGSIKAVSEELGLPYSKVAQYVKFDQLIEPLKEKVKKGLEMKTALRAQRAATRDGEVDERVAVALAEEMSNMAGVQQRQLAKIAERNPRASVEEILEVGRKQPRARSLTVVLSEDIITALNTFAQEEGTSRDEAAATLITSSLTERGYISED